jgi:hypothetical protein
MVKRNRNINKLLIALLMISAVFISFAAQAVEEKGSGISYGPNDAPKAYVPPAVKDSVLIGPIHPLSVSPTVLTATLNPGQSTTEINTVGLSGSSIPKADVVFSFDLTGSMGGVLSTAQSQAIDIMAKLDTVIPDANYGVASHMDYPHTYTSFGYSNTYGGSGDYAYGLNQSITSDRTLVKNAINGLKLGWGSDGPEDYTRQFFESYADTRLGWRPGAKRIFIHFGDSVPHDNNLFEGISGTSSTICSVVYGIYTSTGNICSTGGDPGRDEIMQVTSDPTMIGVGNDDLDLQQVLAGMKSNNVILLEVHNSGSSSYDSILWNNWVNRTGGGFYTISTGGTELSNAIINLTKTSASNIATLSLATVPSSYSSWISTTPVSYTNFTIPSGGLSKPFTVTITPPTDTLPGVYNFKIQAIADGGSVGEQNVSITVTGAPAGRIVQIGTNYTVAVNGTKDVPVQLINGSDVAGGQTTITFDPSTVTVDSVKIGDFLTPTANIDNVAGTVKIAVARPDAVGKSPATLAIVTFRGVAIGSSVLDIGGSSLNDASGLILAAPTEINGKITVGVSGDCGLNGDLNHNGILDTGDATLLLRKVVGLDP